MRNIIDRAAVGRRFTRLYRFPSFKNTYLANYVVFGVLYLRVVAIEIVNRYEKHVEHRLHWTIEHFKR